MSRVNTTLGGGTGDTASAFSSGGAGTDVTSDWNPTNTGMYTSGGFAADGITASTLVPAAIEYIQLKLGNTGSNATVYIQLATAASGSGGYNNSVKTFNSTTGTVFSTGTAQGNSTSPNWAINCDTTYYYGIYVTSGTTIYFARGGTAGNIYINGTLQNGLNGTAAWSNNRISGQVSQRSIASAPGTPTSSNTGFTSTTLTWTQPTDDGTAITAAWTDSNCNGWRINYRVTGTSAWIPYSATGKVTATYNGTSSYSYTVTGLEPGTSYDFQVAALTDTTDAHNTDYSSITAVVGVRSGTVTVKTLGGIWNGGTWMPINNATYRAATNLAVSGSITSGNPTVTCTVASTSALKTGDVITISGGASTWFNGTWTITVTSATQFTYVSGSVTTTATSSGTLNATRNATIKVYNGSSWVTYFQ